MSDKDSPIILVDASSYLFRAYHAMPPLTNSKGLATGAIYGVINMMKRMISDYHPRYLAMIFDAKGKTFRDEMYDQYKANRPPMADDLREQIEPLHRLIKLMGVPVIVESGVEADDVIGTFAKRFSKNQPVLISTGDKDLAQLVNEKVTLINTMNNQLLTPAGVFEKFGVKPDQIIDYLALMGDVVDNVPGIPKVGPKTAAKWLQTYGSIENIINNADKIAGKVGESLRENLSLLPLSSALVTIACDLDLAETLDDLKLQLPVMNALAKDLKSLEFNSWYQETVQHSAGEEKAKINTKFDSSKYEQILTPLEFERWLAKISAAKLTAIDTETTHIDAMQAELVGISLATQQAEACYIPLMHNYIAAPEQLDKAWVLAKLKSYLENPAKFKVGQNLKYDYKIFANEGITLQGITEDTMLQSYVLDSTVRHHDMDSLALKHLDHDCIHFEDIAGKGKKQLTFNQIALTEATPYAAEDADITLQLYQCLKPQLQQYPTLSTLYKDIEIPLIPILAKIERRGVLINSQALLAQSSQLGKRLFELEKQAYTLAGGEFNLSSPKQLQQILFETLKLPILKKTPKGQPSTAEEVLQELALDYPLPKLILEHRNLSKLKSTYTDKLPLQVNVRTGRIHTSYHQAVTATGRLSSTVPNLQNIPIRTAEGRKIRKAFIAPDKCKIIAADYSQIELRIMAHLSQDPGLLLAFENGLDVHRATAAEVFEVSPNEVSQEQRRRAKAINFGLIYGMSAFGLAKQLDVSRDEAKHYMYQYFARYPGVETYMEAIKETAREQGYVETLYGRRLYLPQINAKNGLHRQAAERTAINAPMQGTAADIIKRAMIQIDNWIEKESLPLKMIMQVHDELVFEAPESTAEKLSLQIMHKMSQAAALSVPLTVEAGIGNSWGEAH